MIPQTTIAAAERYVQDCFAADASGHDAHHMLRVRRTACRIARAEGADEGVVALAALLHDVDDPKLSPETTAIQGNARAFLAEHGVDAADADAVLVAISQVSFSKNKDAPPSSIEAACVRDADRLDAIGAIGVARAFAYGGVHGRALHDPSGADAGSTTQHFHDKLLKLPAMMCTEAGKQLAASRGAVTRGFLEEFLQEWDGVR